MSNPFIDIYNALWTGAERNPNLTKYIRPGNRIKFRDQLGTKEQISSGDLPELVLMQAGGPIKLMNSSGTSEIRRYYIWYITTGEYQTEVFNTIQWELIRAMTDWDKFLCPLEWPEESDWHYIEKLDFIDVEEGTSISNLKRNVNGWSAALTMDIGCNFRTEDLRIVI